MDVWEWTPLDSPDSARWARLGEPVRDRSRQSGRGQLPGEATSHRRTLHSGRSHSGAARPFDGRHPLLRHHHRNYQRRTGKHDQDHPHKALRDGLPLLRPRLRGGHRARDACVLDPGCQRCSSGSWRAGGSRNDDIFLEPRHGQAGHTLRHPLPGPAVDARPDTVDGPLLVQAGRGPALADAGLLLQADLATLHRALHGRQPRGLLHKQRARGRHLDRS